MRDDSELNNPGMCDQTRSEWEADQLVALMGKHLGLKRGDSPFDDPRFLNWTMRELRQRPPSRADWSTEKIRALRDRVLERSAALRLSVIAHDGHCVERRAQIGAPILKAIELADAAGCMPLVEEAVAAGVGRELWDETCTRWIERPAQLPAGDYVALPVTGDSMSPLMHSGDIVVVRLGARVQKETVIVARQADDGYVVKCVGEVRRDAIQLTSLNAKYAPFWISRENKAVLGTVVWRACTHSMRRVGHRL